MVLLRMFTEAELTYFDTLPDAAQDPFSFFGFPGAARSSIRVRWAEHGLVSGERGTLAVDLDGAVIGDVVWHTVRYGPPPMSNAFNIGIRLLPEHQGHGHGTAAQQALVSYLFDTYPVNRIEAETDVANPAEQRALESAGFVREGIVRGAQWRSGRWNDLVLYSCLRSDLRR
jgi:RimJ/RimL family protein N-acetyltransferase